MFNSGEIDEYLWVIIREGKRDPRKINKMKRSMENNPHIFEISARGGVRR
jgi:hypothetical protein